MCLNLRQGWIKEKFKFIYNCNILIKHKRNIQYAEYKKRPRK